MAFPGAPVGLGHSGQEGFGPTDEMVGRQDEQHVVRGSASAMEGSRTAYGRARICSDTL